MALYSSCGSIRCNQVSCDIRGCSSTQVTHTDTHIRPRGYRVKVLYLSRMRLVACLWVLWIHSDCWVLQMLAADLCQMLLMLQDCRALHAINESEFTVGCTYASHVASHTSPDPSAKKQQIETSVFALIQSERPLHEVAMAGVLHAGAVIPGPECPSCSAPGFHPCERDPGRASQQHCPAGTQAAVDYWGQQQLTASAILC